MSTTLFGGRKITISLEGDPATPNQVEVTVRQIPIRDYDAGFKSFTDEIELVALMVGKPREFVMTLTPESYEEILAAGREVNERGFFAFCRRRIEADTQKEALNAAALAQLPEAARKTIIEQGAKMMASQTLNESSSTPRPRRV